MIIPTLNEADNIGRTLAAVAAALAGGPSWEIVVVDDDSSDGTRERAVAALDGGRLRVLHRVGRRGLASAVFEGFSLARGRFLAVCDADGSHAPRLLPRLLDPVRTGETDFALGSRYVRGGSTPDWPLGRRVLSRLVCLTAAPLVGVSDPSSGFFALRRELLDGPPLRPRGYKIALEILGRRPRARVLEIPITFVDRRRGASKLGLRVILHYFLQLACLWRSRL